MFWKGGKRFADHFDTAFLELQSYLGLTDTAANQGSRLFDEETTRDYENGVLVWNAGRRGRVLRLLPPLATTRDQAETALNVVTGAIDYCTPSA